MTDPLISVVSDSGELRKARGAFFTPAAISEFIAAWAIRSADERVLEPSAGDAAFLVEAVKRLKELGAERPPVTGIEIHEHSARVARERVLSEGGDPTVIHSDFFLVEPTTEYTAVIGNPPYIRFQDFSGDSRALSRAVALKAGVALSGLASSWASFTVQSASFLAPGGRLGLVLPAEMLSVNYAAPVRQFLFDKFRTIDLVLFEEQVFPEAEADVVLLLADGYGLGTADHAAIHQAVDTDSLQRLAAPTKWSPTNPSAKWSGLLVDSEATATVGRLTEAGHYVPLETWGDTTLGMVTGNNSYFALSPERIAELNLPRRELLRLSPPGSAHLRGLSLTTRQLQKLGQRGKSTWLFRPAERPSDAAAAYLEAGHLSGVDQAYKCRVRKVWHQVPLLEPADLLLTCMNADTPRLTTNEAGARHLNSVHGVYLKPETRDLARELLPLASLNSVTLMNAETVGRSYGGGILKLEPREADVWAVPSPRLVQAKAEDLRAIRGRVARRLRRGDLLAAVELVDEVLLERSDLLNDVQLSLVREARASMAARRTARAESGR